MSANRGSDGVGAASRWSASWGLIGEATTFGARAGVGARGVTLGGGTAVTR